MFCSYCGSKNPRQFKFCVSCGKARVKTSNGPESEPSSLSELKQIAELIHVYFSGRDGVALDQRIAGSLDVKKSTKILFNVYASERNFVVLPASKDKGSIIAFGLLLGGGGLAGGAMGALEALSKKMESKEAKNTLQKQDVMKNALVFSKSSLRLSVKEQRANTGGLSDLYKKETWFLVSGIGVYNDQEYDAAVKFGFAGQVTNPNKPVLGVLDALCSALKIEPPPIHTGKDVPF